MQITPKPEEKIKVQTEIDYIYAEKHKNSLKNFIQKHQKTVTRQVGKGANLSTRINTFEGIGDHRISYMLLISPEEVKSSYDGIVQRARLFIESGL
jgi:hypothetical protein